MSRSLLTVATAAQVALAIAGCRDRAGDETTSRAEVQASETTLTQATIEPEAETEVGAADEGFAEQQQFYRERVRLALDAFDAVAPAHLTRDAKARKERLARDLRAIDRCTQPEWATLKPAVERDLAVSQPDPQ